MACCFFFKLLKVVGCPVTECSFTLQVATEEQQTSGVGEASSKRYGMTAGGQVREDELMAALQMLLDKVEKGQFAMPSKTAHNQVDGILDNVQFNPFTPGVKP